MSRPRSQSNPWSRLYIGLQAMLTLLLLAAATLPLSAPAVSPDPARAETAFQFEEDEEEGEEEWELEEEAEAEEIEEEEEFGTRAMAPLPPECLLRTVEPSIVAQLANGSLRLTLRYTARTPTKVGLDYWLKGGKGSLQLGSVKRHFERQGVLHLSHHLDEREVSKVRAARVFIVDLDVPAAPASCRQYLTLHLSAKHLHRSRATWSERSGS